VHRVLAGAEDIAAEDRQRFVDHTARPSGLTTAPSACIALPSAQRYEFGV
jgi:hypothetical protein